MDRFFARICVFGNTVGLLSHAEQRPQESLTQCSPPSEGLAGPPRQQDKRRKARRETQSLQRQFNARDWCCASWRVLDRYRPSPAQNGKKLQGTLYDSGLSGLDRYRPSPAQNGKKLQGTLYDSGLSGLGAGRPFCVMHGNGNRDGRGDYATHYQRIPQQRWQHSRPLTAYGAGGVAGGADKQHPLL